MSYQGYFIDLDGTMYRGKTPIPAAKRFIERLQAAKIPFLFVTNNTTKTPADVKQNLADNFDIYVDESNVYTAALATADYLKKTFKKNKSAYVIGESGLKSAIVDAGFKMEETNPEVVVVGLDYDATYHKFELATLAIKRGATFIGTNEDTNLPNERGLVPGAGSLIALVERSTQQEALYIGKPQKIIMENALDRIGLAKKDVVMVGDNYNTDIMAGINFEMDTLLVYSGYSTQEEVAQAKIQPTIAVESLDDWDLKA